MLVNLFKIKFINFFCLQNIYNVNIAEDVKIIHETRSAN